MCDYELVAIVSPDTTDDALATKLETVNQFIAERQGVVEETQRWGKKRLAYPIRKYVEGNYSLMRFKLAPDHVREVREVLENDLDVLRYLVIKRSK